MNASSFTSKDVHCTIIYTYKVIKATKLSYTRKLVKLNFDRATLYSIK